MGIAEQAAIAALADAVGIEPSYRDTDGNIQEISSETRRGILQAMGFDLRSAAAVDAALQQQHAAQWQRLVAPVIVLRRSPGAVGATIALTLPEALLSRRLEWCVQLEGGETRTGALLPESLDRLDRDGRYGSFVRLRLPLPIDLVDGYHRMILAIAGSETAATLIVTPPAAFVPEWLERGERQWGLACPLFAVWSGTSWGIGDFSDLTALVRTSPTLGASVVGLNPLHAPLPGERGDPSPYLPSSRIFLNTAYIDATKVLPPEDCRGPQFAARVAQAQRARLVDYPLVHRLKQEALEAAFRSHRRDGEAELQRFRAGHGRQLHRFAVFNVLQEQFGATPWQLWPERLRKPNADGIPEFVRQHAERVDYHVWSQWIAERQLAAAAAVAEDGGGLYLDLAVGVSPNGADAWADQDTYLAGASIGAPPDAFNPAGQDWGMPPPSPIALQASAYAPFIAGLRANMRHAHILRIDHVMGIQRLFWVPTGQSAKSGAYVRYPVDDMLGILALESQRNRCMVVGEDLGTLPDGFHERMAAAKILSYRLTMFERYDNGLFRRPATYPTLGVATFGTHDLPTIRSWWDGQDIALRRELGLSTPGEAEREARNRQEDRQLLLAALRDQQLIGPEPPHDPDELMIAIQRFVARTPSALMIANLTDLLSEAAQINVPGTVTECPNWRHRCRAPVDALATDPLIRRIAAAVAAERRS